jgi:hypothetical protein
MQRHRRSHACAGAQSDAGVTVLGVIFGALFTMTAIAVAGTAIVLSKRHDENPHGFTLSITKSTAVRDTSDLPVIQVSYRINFKDVFAVKAQETPVHVRCFGQGGSSGGTFTGENDSVRPQHVYYFGENVIAPGETYRDLEGALQIRCFLSLSGATLSHADDTVNVPKQTATDGTSGATSAGVTGIYNLVFTRSSGSETDCVIDGEREITVTALTASTIRVSINETDAFDSDLSPDLRYTGSLALNPGFTDYYGRMDGQFASTANGIQVAGTMKTGTPDCTFGFQGAQH